MDSLTSFWFDKKNQHCWFNSTPETDIYVLENIKKYCNYCEENVPNRVISICKMRVGLPNQHWRWKCDCSMVLYEGPTIKMTKRKKKYNKNRLDKET
jgi:hypothetical protein